MEIKEAVHLYEEAFRKIKEANAILEQNDIGICSVSVDGLDNQFVHIYRNIEKLADILGFDLGYFKRDCDKYPDQAFAEYGDIKFFEIGRMENGIFKG